MEYVYSFHELLQYRFDQNSGMIPILLLVFLLIFRLFGFGICEPSQNLRGLIVLRICLDPIHELSHLSNLRRITIQLIEHFFGFLIFPQG